MSKITIYHNNRCSKSRQTLDILEGYSNDVTIINYLDTPPSVKELSSLCKKLDMSPYDLIRKKEKTFKELNISSQEKLTDNQWLELMVKHPILIERPIVVYGNQARIGRPPEKILEII